MSAFSVWRTPEVAGDPWRGFPSAVPQHRHAFAKGTVQLVVLLKLAAPHDDAVHDTLRIGRRTQALSGAARTVTVAPAVQQSPD